MSGSSSNGRGSRSCLLLHAAATACSLRQWHGTIMTYVTAAHGTPLLWFTRCLHWMPSSVSSYVWPWQNNYCTSQLRSWALATEADEKTACNDVKKTQGAIWGAWETVNLGTRINKVPVIDVNLACDDNGSSHPIRCRWRKFSLLHLFYSFACVEPIYLF